jgi:hypothetical protein
MSSCSHDMRRHGYRLGGWYMRQARYGGSVPEYFRARGGHGVTNYAGQPTYSGPGRQVPVRTGYR